MLQSNQDRAVALRAFTTSERRRRARGQVSGIAIPGRYPWRLNEESAEAFLKSGPMATPPSPLGAHYSGCLAGALPTA